MRVCRVHVEGRVQGVYFRAFTREHARSLGLRGYARNLADGRVEVLAGGSHDAIEALLVLLRRGPPLAEVQALSVVELEPAALDGVAGFARE